MGKPRYFSARVSLYICKLLLTLAFADALVFGLKKNELLALFIHCPDPK